MKKGKLTYNYDSKRYEIKFIDNSEFQLHCGECFQVKGNDYEWYDTRIEFSWETESWYLIDFAKGFKLEGAEVRM